jgi:hypothetical protein
VTITSNSKTPKSSPLNDDGLSYPNLFTPGKDTLAPVEQQAEKAPATCMNALKKEKISCSYQKPNHKCVAVHPVVSSLY